MFGMSLPEIIMIAVIAVLFLGPDKLPQAMVEIAKFFKTFKKTINDAKANFDQEIKIQELKEDARKYKESFTQTTENVRKKLTFEELDELKKGVSEVTGGLSDNINSIKKDIENIKNPKEMIKDKILNQDSTQKPQEKAEEKAVANKSEEKKEA
ncbi:Sec-independent protein translocase protein TatB [Campylobacter sp.]|uniref:Sec-independent protein translocase protein TatB n=1 Tax=Campylobacter sp. TaxID=205 RepID=UPI0027081FB1|nr:Sec-independent protein translocase protein TatB [Campylobacter sp.]